MNCFQKIVEKAAQRVDIYHLFIKTLFFLGGLFFGFFFNSNEANEIGEKTPKKNLMKINKGVQKNMSQYDPDADYDTKVKLPEWQLKKF
ncbi:MAG: hypothetical protein CM15mP51_16980 [Porticoccaceae bacterium]|nr:MAG: hypothetical protein CM15mP51_16980 [Porticoccaceae bacterium]